MRQLWHSERVTAKRAAAAVVEAPSKKTSPRIQGSPRVGPDQLEKLAARVVTAGPRVRVAVTMPFTGETLGEVPRCKPEDVRAAFERAWRAQREWAEVPLAERVRPFLRYHDLLLDRQDEALDLIQLECGKSRLNAYEEIVDGALIARHYAHHAADYLEPVRRKGAVPALTYTYEHRHPKGVVGLISPWNFPLVLSMSDSVPALIAGNAVVMKPDLQSPFTALWAAALLEEAGLPADLLLIVTGEGTELGPELIAHCDYVSFTGSTATGRRIAAQAAERLVSCSLELGGKNPMLVLADADLEAAARGATRGCFAAAGQLCVSIERLYVHESLYHRFLKLFVDETQAVRLGASLDYSCNVGSLASAAQLRKVEEHVRDAVAKGATVAAGGRARPDLGPLFLRADHPHRRDAGDEALRRGDLRAGGRGLHVRQQQRRGRARQRHPLRTQRQRLDARHRQGAAARDPHPRRLGQHQRGVRRELGLGRRPDGRLQGLGPRPPARRRGHLALHRGADHRHAAGPGAGAAPGGERRDLHQGVHRRAESAETNPRAPLSMYCVRVRYLTPSSRAKSRDLGGGTATRSLGT